MCRRRKGDQRIEKNSALWITGSYQGTSQSAVGGAARARDIRPRTGYVRRWSDTILLGIRRRSGSTPADISSPHLSKSNRLGPLPQPFIRHTMRCHSAPKCPPSYAMTLASGRGTLLPEIHGSWSRHSPAEPLRHHRRPDVLLLGPAHWLKHDQDLAGRSNRAAAADRGLGEQQSANGANGNAHGQRYRRAVEEHRCNDHGDGRRDEMQRPHQ